MADQTRDQREQAAIREHYARRDFSRMSPQDVYDSFCGMTAPVHRLTADPAEFVRRSPYCTDLTDEQRDDVVDKLRQYVRTLSTGSRRNGIRVRIGVCTDILRREVPALAEMGAQKRIPHETMLRRIGRLKGILERLESNLRDDSILPTDPDGVEWVDVYTQVKIGYREYDLEARVYLEAGHDDSDIVDAVVTSLDDDNERDHTVDPDEEFGRHYGDIWRQALREAAHEKACELGLCCSRCGDYLGDECSCAEQREVAHA